MSPEDKARLDALDALRAKPHDWFCYADAAHLRDDIAFLRRLLDEATQWRPIGTAPKDGFGFLAYGRYSNDEGRLGRYKKGDHFWAIIQWDIWREPHQWVFGKDGKSITDWGEPTHWLPLQAPAEDQP